jgi:DNA repair exonuclease SbcCD ATPase subunit
MAEGFVLNIDNTFLKRLESADKKIQQLGSSSEHIEKRIIEAFTNMGQKGVGAFTRKLHEAQEKLNALGTKGLDIKLNVDSKSIDDLKKKLDEIITVQTKVQQVQKVQSSGGGKKYDYSERDLDIDLIRLNEKLAREEKRSLEIAKQKTKELRETNKEYKDILARTKQWQRQNTEEIESYRTTPKGALSYASNAKTINEQIKALNYLRTAQKSLDVSTSQGKKQFYELEREIKRTENALRRYGVQLGGVREQSSHLFNISQQLGRALSLMFSVSQIGQYISKMVNVRKEMELQQRSLQVLLQSKDKANVLWNQTLDLAVKSPFRVKELVTYTKQLAAYRIESDKLFETNKMLADVSAGLGVDMQRLILAFGQVKSASFLRGTELRQFTEAGIPMLEELSEYFEELYGRSVSVAEVFDMISKRMVTFTDVETVFQRMTSAGGVFFNMQEELSQTTAGMISNLQDSIDLMFNEIGKKNQGVVNTAIKLARGLVDNWETIGKVMKGTLVTLLLYKAATMDINKSLAGISAKWGNISAGFSLLKSDTLGFVSAFKGNIILTALTAIAAILAVIIKRHMEYKAAIKEIVKEYDKLDSTLNNLTIDIYQTDDLDEAKQKLLELKNVAKSDFGINVDIQLQNLDSIEQVREEFNKLEQQLKSMNDFTYVIKYQMVEEDTGKEKRERNKERREANRDEDLTNDMARSKGLTKDIEQLGEYSDRLNKTFINVDSLLGDLLKKQDELNDVQQQFVKAFDTQGDTESDADFFNRRMEGLKLLAEQYEKFYNEVEVDYQSEIAPDIQRMFGARDKVKKELGLDIDAVEIKELLKLYNSQLNTVNSGIEEVLSSGWGKLNTDIARLENEMKSKGASENEISESIKKLIETYYTSAIKSISTDKEWNDLTEHQAYLIGEQIAKEKGYEVKLVPEIESPDPVKLKEWQQKFNKEVEKASKSISGKMKTEEYNYDLFRVFDINEDEQGLATTETKKLAELNQALDEAVKRREEILGKQRNKSPLFRQDELDDINLYIEKLTDLRNVLGGDDEKKGKNTAEERIKEQIRLIKELYQEYQKLSKSMGAQEAFSFVSKDFAKSFEEVGLNINDIDFTNISGVVSFLEGLRPKAEEAGKDAKFALEKAISETAVELTVMFHVQNAKAFENEIKDMFSDYEIGLELEKLDIPSDWAEKYFGIENVSLEDIQAKLNDRKSLIENSERELSTIIKNTTDETQKQSLIEQQKGYKDEREFISKQEQKINELIAKQQYERLKTYLGYARNAIGEHAKIKLEEYNKLAEIEKMYAKKLADEGRTELTKEEEAQKQKIVDSVQKETKGKEQKLAWEQFQESETFLNILGDLEQASNTVIENMINKLEEYKDQWTDMPLEDIKRLTDTINKLKESLYEDMGRNEIFQDIIDKTSQAEYEGKKFSSNKEIRQYARGGGLKQSQEAISNAEQEMVGINQEIDQLEYYIRLLEEGKEIKLEDLNISQNTLNSIKALTGFNGKNKTSAEIILKSKRKELKDQQKIVRANTNNLDVIKAYIQAQQNVITKTKNTQDNVGKLKEGYDDVVALIGEMGGETENLELFGGSLMDSFTLITNMIMLQAEINAATVAAEGMGVAMNAAMGPIGWIVMAIQLIVKAISTIIKAQDNAIVKQIELAQEKVDALRKEYEKLLNTIEEGYAESSIVSAYNQAKIDMQKMLKLQQQMIDLNDRRKQKKEVKEEGKELRKDMEEMEEQLVELQKEYISKITGGIIDNVLDASSTFVDAWLDAFRETGDGLSGLEDNFKEMIGDLVKQQASMLISEQFLGDWKERLSRLAEGGLTESEVKGWRDMVENDLPALNDLLKTFYSGFEDITAGEGELTGLQRGIQGITEQQADILASYLNSIRFIVTDSNTQLKAIVAAQTQENNARGENPMVEQLKVIAQQTSAINTLLSSLVKGGHSMGGSGLKVFI